MQHFAEKNIADQLPYAYFICKWNEIPGKIVEAGGATLDKLKEIKGISFFRTINEVFPKIPWNPIFEKLNVGKDAYYTEKIKENWYFIKITKLRENELSVLCLDFPNLYMTHFVKGIILSNVKSVYGNYHKPVIFLSADNKISYYNQLVKKEHIDFLQELQKNSKWKNIRKQIEAGKHYFLKTEDQKNVAVFFPVVFEESYLGSLIILENKQVSAKKLIYRLEEFSQNLHRNLVPDEEVFQAHFRDYFVLSNNFAPYGSFYWFSQQFDNFILVLIDTEQYDIRGAYWSFLIHSLLKNIVNEKLTIYPSEIVEQLHKNLHKFWKGYAEMEDEESEEFETLKIASVSIPNKFTHFRHCSKGIGIFLLHNKKLREFVAEDLNIKEEEVSPPCLQEKHKLPEKSTLLIFRKDLFEAHNLYEELKKILVNFEETQPLEVLKEKIKTFCKDHGLWYNTNLQIIALKI